MSRLAIALAALMILVSASAAHTNHSGTGDDSPEGFSSIYGSYSPVLVWLVVAELLIIAVLGVYSYRIYRRENTS